MQVQPGLHRQRQHREDSISRSIWSSNIDRGFNVDSRHHALRDVVSQSNVERIPRALLFILAEQQTALQRSAKHSVRNVRRTSPNILQSQAQCSGYRCVAVACRAQSVGPISNCGFVTYRPVDNEQRTPRVCRALQTHVIELRIEERLCTGDEQRQVAGFAPSHDRIRGKHLDRKHAASRPDYPENTLGYLAVAQHSGNALARRRYQRQPIGPGLLLCPGREEIRCLGRLKHPARLGHRPSPIPQSARRCSMICAATLPTAGLVDSSD